MEDSLENGSLSPKKVVQEINGPLIDQAPFEKVPEKTPNLARRRKIIRTAVVLSYLLFVMTMTGIFLIIVNRNRPNYPILPDLLQSAVKYLPGSTIVTSVMTASIVVEIIFILCDSRRLKILKRVAMIYATIMLIRNCTMIVTSLPDPSPLCPYGLNANESISLKNIIVALVGGKTCGDMIFSGHTIGFMMPPLIHMHYFNKWIALVFWAIALVGVPFLVIVRLHYTVDVVLSFFFCVLIFWIYHLCAENPVLASKLPTPVLKYFAFMEWEAMLEESNPEESVAPNV